MLYSNVIATIQLATTCGFAGVTWYVAYSLKGITKCSVRDYVKIQKKMNICKNNFIWVTSFF